MNPTEPSTIARFDWSMGSISKDSTFFREVDLAVAVDAISLTTFLDLIKEREHIIAFATSCNPPSITHIYEAGGLLEHLRESKIDPQTKNRITNIYWFAVRLFEGNIVTEYITSKLSYISNSTLIWNMDQALQGDQESAYDAGIYLDIIDREVLALRYFEMADKFPEALYERYVRNHDEDLLLSAAKGGSWRACNDLGVRSAKRGIFTDAKEWFQNAEPEGVLYYNLAQLLRRDGYERDAKKYYKLSWENGFTPAANNLGVIAFNKDKKEKAAKLLSTAAHHTDTITRENYARVLEDQGKYILAAGQWRVLGNIERQIAALQRIEAPPAKRSRIELKFDERFFSVSEAESLAFYREI